MHIYGSEFYNMITEIIQDEEQIIPYVLERLKPTSIVDFGCGEGRWLAEAKRNNKNIKVLGLDGYYVRKDNLSISEDEFLEVDLRRKIELADKYDLAISTEVAEHIEEEYVDVFLDNLTRASDCILFSAAVPGQGGEHHVNEQWQSYWVKKFKNQGYEADFSIRNHFWGNNSINTWRRQNILLFFKSQSETVCTGLVDVVHPGMIQHCVDLCRREMGVPVEYMMRFPKVLECIRKPLERLVEQKKAILIYPYGRNGRVCELMLTYLFHYDNFLIVDNKLGGKKKKILTFDEISSEYKHAVILDVCSNASIHQELLDEIRGIAGEMDRVIVFND